MEQYTVIQNFKFESGVKKVLFAFMGVGIICLAINFFADDELHTRFWSNILVNSAFFTGIAVMALFFYAANIIGLSGWYTGFKRIWEAMYGFLPVGLLLMTIYGLGTVFDFHHVYHWAIEEEVATDPLLQHKSGFLNSGWYLAATIVFGGIWFYIGWKIRQLSKKEDKEGTIEFKYHRRMQFWAAVFLPIGGFTVAAAVWLWVMSVDPHWYSTLFAWYCMISWLVAFFALVILVLKFLKAKGYYSNVTNEHIHDMSKYLFAFSIFWTYLWFSQFMLIWYANIGEETIYFNVRMDQYPVLFYGNLVINFILPFFIFMRNDTKRKTGTVVFIAIMVFFGHWLDYFLMIKPGALHTAHEVLGTHHDAGIAEAHGSGHGDDTLGHASEFVSGFTLPGLLEIGIFVGFLSLFLYIFFNNLQKARLVPVKDPYLEESLHHHV